MEFATQEDLRTFLESLKAGYRVYAQELWCRGVTTTKELAYATIEDLEAAGVARFHANAIKAEATKAEEGAAGAAAATAPNSAFHVQCPSVPSARNWFITLLILSNKQGPGALPWLPRSRLAKHCWRGSDDASAKAPGGSPKQVATQAKTVALGDETVTLEARFPGIKHVQEQTLQLTLEEDTLDFVARALLEPALRLMSLSQQQTEAARVHVAGSMLLAALIMFPQPATLTFTECASLADEVSLVEQAGTSAQLQLGFEQAFRAGSFKGRVELQVLRTTPQNVKLFAGAVEVKREGDLNTHIGQAKKEAFAMWCHNALRQSYEPVWVVLTDLSKVLRVSYSGYNRPGGTGKPYEKRMPCAWVQGEVRCTPEYPFILKAEGKPVASQHLPYAVQCFVGGLLGGGDVSLDQIRQHVDRHNEQTQQQVEQMVTLLHAAKKARTC